MNLEGNKKIEEQNFNFKKKLKDFEQIAKAYNKGKVTQANLLKALEECFPEINFINLKKNTF